MSRRRWIECDQCGALEPEEDTCSSCECCLDCCECNDELFDASELGYDPEDYDVPIQEKRKNA